MNVDIQKEGFVDIELKEGKKITLSEVDMDGRLLSYKGHQVVLYIRDHVDDSRLRWKMAARDAGFMLLFAGP